MGITMSGIDKVCIYIALGLVFGCLGTGIYQKGELEQLENRIERLEMEATTNKLLLKQTQRLVVPNERALKEKIR